MKIALAQLNFHIGNFDQNSKKIIDSIKTAKQKHADLVIFPELAITGYPPRDFLEFDDFILKTEKAIHEIALECDNIAAIIGAPVKNESLSGKRLYNSALFLNNGRIEKITRKTLLPNYDIFDEYRYFEPNHEFSTLEFQDRKIAITICEDLWGLGDSPMYSINPMDKLIEENPDLIINIAASPYDHTQLKKRMDILKANATRYHLPIVYVNHTGAQTELIFDGNSCVIDEEGNCPFQAAAFEESIVYYNTDSEDAKKNTEFYHPTEISNIHKALITGIRNYFRKLGFQKALLGLSGGIDSAVTLVLAVEALGKQNVMSIIMPSQFSSDHSVRDSEELAYNLDSPYKIIPIENIYKAYQESLAPIFENRPFDIAEENIQARARAILLMAYSNKFGNILLNTSNKSEAAVGYGTLYGDMCGGLSVIGDLYKTKVYELARFINREREIIPENIINKAPSAELRPEQRDSDSLPDYAILDQILDLYIEKQTDPEDILAKGFHENVVRKILKLVNMTEHKRYQAPPALRVSPKAFGMGRRMPIVAKYLT